MSSARVLFIDITTPKPYDPEVLKTQPLGGTEASVIRIAEGLAEKKHYRVAVAQHCRTESRSGFADYIPLEGVESQKPDVVVMLRKVELKPFVDKTFPRAKQILYMEDFNHQDLVTNYGLIHDSGIKILGVSRTHKTIISDALLSQVKNVKGVTVDFIYNPIADDLGDIKVRPDPTKLVFFSSPHKGLDHTLEVFKKVREKWPEMKLHVANPGYYESRQDLPEGVAALGELPHAKMMEQLKDAFAVFYLNHVFPETQGICFHEALALGVPVLTHPVGSAREVLANPEFTVDTRNVEEVLKRLEKWRAHRPVASVTDEVRLKNVLNRWERVLQ